jgi:glycosyltransferase involved in cell wall biosynthesis
MKVWLLGVPHSLPDDTQTHCAFTGGTMVWPRMMRAQGVHVIYIGVEGADVGANEHIEVMTRAEHRELLGHDYNTTPVGADARVDSPLVRQWNYYARAALEDRMEPGDIVALPFGRLHEATITGLPMLASKQCAAFESGIGYPNPFLPFRVYESECWRHVLMQAEARAGVSFESARLEWVVPHYFEVARWPFVAEPTEKNRIVFLGRIGTTKGCDLIPKLAADRPDLTFVLCGDGDPTPFLAYPNVTYQPAISGAARAEYLGNARAIICPSRYVEPFGYAHMEAMFTGTPVISSSFGVFTETVEQGCTGFRCQTRREWLAALDGILGLDRAYIRDRAIARCSTEVVGPRYVKVLDDISSTLVTHVGRAPRGTD